MSIDHTNQSQNPDQPQAQLEQQPLHDYVIHKTLGEGNFGKVKKGIHKITGQEVAIKILEKDLIYQKTDIERISRQIKIMKQTRHPNIIQLYEIIETSKRLYLIMEFAKNGDLFDEIVRVDQIPQQEAQQYFAQMILGLEYLHSLGITHRDLKPENLLLSGESDQIKIADFGLGNFFTSNQLLKTACGSPCYAPPQMLNKLSYDPRKVDLWSSGIILHAMVLGYLPFEDDVTSKLYQKIKTSDFKLPFRLSMPCKELIRSLLTKDPAQRISLEQVKQHQWLKSSIQNYNDTNFEIDERIFKAVCDRFGIVEEERLMTNLKKNKHNNLTTLYYLGQKVVRRNIGSERSADRSSTLKEDITFNNLIEEADSDRQGCGDAEFQKEMDHRQKKHHSDQQLQHSKNIKDVAGKDQQVSKQAEAAKHSVNQNGKKKQVNSSQKVQSTSNVAPREKEQPQVKEQKELKTKESIESKTKQSENAKKTSVKDQKESDSNSKPFEAHSSTIAVKIPSNTQAEQNRNMKEENSLTEKKQESKVSEPQDLNKSNQFMQKQKDRLEQDENFSLKEQLRKQQHSPKYKSSTLDLPQFEELEDHFQSQYYHEVKNNINTEQFEDEDIEPKKSPPKKVHQSPPKEVNHSSLKQANQQPPKQANQQPFKKPYQQPHKQIRQQPIKDKVPQQPLNQIGISTLQEIRQSPSKQKKETPPKEILAGLKNKGSIKKPIEKKVIRKQSNNASVRQQVLNKTLPVTISKNFDKKQPQISKIAKQATKKLVKNPRMPIHNPHINDRPTPPLYEHSQSKERPLQLKKIIIKASPVEPHLWDPKKIVLCTIDYFATILQQKGFGGRIDYFPFGQGIDSGIYIMKNGVTGKGLGMVIKDINSKAK